MAFGLEQACWVMGMGLGARKNGLKEWVWIIWVKR
jgi:hypothetical protein